MTWTLQSCDHLALAVPADGHALLLASPSGGFDLCALLAGPPVRHVFLEIYTARASEIVIASSCAAGVITIVRGATSTVPRDWPQGACVRTLQIIDGPIPDPYTGPLDDVPYSLTTCGALSLTYGDLGPTLCLTPTGVVAGEYGGGRMHVNAFGQITYLSADFPAGALPVFDPCGDGGSGGGGSTAPSDASEITFTSSLSACVALSGTVQSALRALDAQLCATMGIVAAKVSAVNAGPGVNVTGSVKAIVSLEQIHSGVTAGGLVADEFGRVLSYAPPTLEGDDIVGTAPIGVTRAVGGSWQISVSAAAIGALGVVQLVGVSQLDTPNTIPSTAVVSWAVLQEWWSRSRSFICSVDLTSITSREQRSTIEAIVCGPSGLTKVNLTELLDAAGAPFARARVLDGVAEVSDNVLTIEAIVDGFSVVFAQAAPRGFHVSATAYNLLALPVISAVTPSGFTLKWRTTADAALIVPQWSFVVFLGDG